MCHVAVIEFFIDNVKTDEIAGKRVLEVGSKYVNGSVRPFIERFCHPREYIGVDVEPGKFVDIVLPAEETDKVFGPESFDVIICTELLEHVKNWKHVVTVIKKVLRPEGILFVTSRSRGFPYHAYPNDFWRYEAKDMEEIFGDLQLAVLKTDPEAPGIFLKAKKPERWTPTNLSNVELYSIILKRRTVGMPELNDMSRLRKIRFIALSKAIDKLLTWALNKCRMS